MKRYDAKTKENALTRAQEIGVKQAGEELGISIQTLYKWRNENKSAQGFPRDSLGAMKTNEEIMALLKEDKALEKKVRQLEGENAELRLLVIKLRKALLATME